MMAMPMNTAGTTTSSAHRTRLRRCSRIPARNTAISRERAGTRRVVGAARIAATGRAVAGSTGERNGVAAFIRSGVAGASVLVDPADDVRGAGAGLVVVARRTMARLVRPDAQSSDQPTSPRGPA